MGGECCIILEFPRSNVTALPITFESAGHFLLWGCASNGGKSNATGVGYGVLGGLSPALMSGQKSQTPDSRPSGGER